MTSPFHITFEPGSGLQPSQKLLPRDVKRRDVASRGYRRALFGVGIKSNEADLVGPHFHGVRRKHGVERDRVLAGARSTWGQHDRAVAGPDALNPRGAARVLRNLLERNCQGAPIDHRGLTGGEVEILTERDNLRLRRSIRAYRRSGTGAADPDEQQEPSVDAPYSHQRRIMETGLGYRLPVTGGREPTSPEQRRCGLGLLAGGTRCACARA